MAEKLKIKWGDCSWEEVKAAAEQGALAVAPFGSTEQHGPQLPVDTDVHIAYRAANDGARRAAEQYGVRALVMPTMPFGLALHHMHFAGTVSFQPETYMAVVADMLRCAVKHGFRKIGVVSGHGGNRPGLQLGIAKVVNEYRDRFPLRIALFRGADDPAFAQGMRDIWKDEPSEGQISIHASRSETSETLNDRPELVCRDRLERPKLLRETVPEWWWMTHELSETGAFGDPTLARPELGEKIWNVFADGVARFLKRLADEPL
ncbi:MAG: creatininase family protein [Kiritimatiellae bacterium]|nr:creatininase family protein [Kiritimatiellia bacterium]